MIDCRDAQVSRFQYDVETPNLGVYIHPARHADLVVILYIRLIVETPRFPGFQYDVETPNLGVYIRPARHAGLIVILYIRLIVETPNLGVYIHLGKVVMLGCGVAGGLAMVFY